MQHKYGGDRRTPFFRPLPVPLRQALLSGTVSFRGIKKLRQHPHKSPVGVKFKFSDDYSLPFHMGAPTPLDFQMSNGK